MIELEEIRLSDFDGSDIDDSVSVKEVKSKPEKPHDVGKEDWYIKSATLPGSWFRVASSLTTDNILNVALAIWHVRGMNGKSNVVSLDRFIFDRFGVLKDSARRGLERLELAGLIRFAKEGQRFLVTILDVKSENSAEIGKCDSETLASD